MQLIKHSKTYIRLLTWGENVPLTQQLSLHVSELKCIFQFVRVDKKLYAWEFYKIRNSIFLKQQFSTNRLIPHFCGNTRITDKSVFLLVEWNKKIVGLWLSLCFKLIIESDTFRSPMVRKEYLNIYFSQIFEACELRKLSKFQYRLATEDVNCSFSRSGELLSCTRSSQKLL
jgi:hypothetical protein